MKIQSIQCIGGMIEKPSQRKDLIAHCLTQEQINEDLIQEIRDKDLLSISGTLGMKEGGVPIQYEHVKITGNGLVTEFEVYNRAISMFLDETPELKRIFPFCSKLQILFRD